MNLIAMQSAIASELLGTSRGELLERRGTPFGRVTNPVPRVTVPFSQHEPALTCHPMLIWIAPLNECGAAGFPGRLSLTGRPLYATRE
jgi:hypothetical protein